jgi:hypothetical protein
MKTDSFVLPENQERGMLAHVHTKKKICQGDIEGTISKIERGKVRDRETMRHIQKWR